MVKENTHTKMVISIKDLFQTEKDKDKDYTNPKHSNSILSSQNKNSTDKLFLPSLTEINIKAMSLTVNSMDLENIHTKTALFTKEISTADKCGVKARSHTLQEDKYKVTRVKSTTEYTQE